MINLKNVTVTILLGLGLGLGLEVKGQTTILSATNANPVVFTTGVTTNLVTGGRVRITGGSGNWAAVNGRWNATVSTGSNFSIPINSSGFGAMTGNLRVKFYRVVCNSTSDTLHNGMNCVETSINTAVDEGLPGDEIIVKAGQTISGNVSMNDGHNRLKIKSSLVDFYPRGKRMERNHPYSAKLQGATNTTSNILTFGNDSLVTNGPISGANIPFAGGHGFTVGEIVYPAGINMAPYVCNAVTQSGVGYDSLTTECTGDANYADKFNFGTAAVGANFFLSDGHPIRLIDVDPDKKPANLTVGEIYYIRDYGINVVHSYFNLALTPGGTAIDVSDAHLNSGMIFEIMPQENQVKADYIRLGDPLWVVSSGVSNVQVSRTHGGSAITWAWGALTYGGSGDNGVNLIRKRQTNHDITFDGIEVTSSGTEGFLWMTAMSGAYAKPLEAYHFNFYRMWIHGQKDNLYGPYVGIVYRGREGRVKDSIVEQFWHWDSSDTQAISLGLSAGKFSLENTQLIGASQGFMAGGATGYDMTREIKDVRVYRTFSTKNQNWINGIQWTLSGTSMTNRAYYHPGTVACGSETATIIFNHCWWIDVPAGDLWRIMPATTISLTGSASGVVYIYGMNNTYYLRHSLASGTVSCPGGWDCAYEASTTYPEDSNNLARITVTSGSFVASEQRDGNVKPAWELKDGENVTFIGNVGGDIRFDPAWQGVCWNLTANTANTSVGANLQWRVGAKNALFTNNVCRNAAEGILLIGKSYNSCCKQIDGTGDTGNYLMRNNFFYNLGSVYYNNAASMSFGAPLRTQRSKNIWFQNNSTIDNQHALGISAGAVVGFQGDYSVINLHLNRNLYVPFLGGDLTDSNSRLPNVLGQGCTSWNLCQQAGFKNIGLTSTFTDNAVFNRNGLTGQPNTMGAYPNGIPSGNYFVNDTSPNVDPADYLESFVERTPGSDYIAIYKTQKYFWKSSEVATYTPSGEQPIGYDPDELNHYVGPNQGDDVINGLEIFWKRTGREISVTSTTMTIRYRPEGNNPCTIDLYTNRHYTGTPAFSATESSMTVVNGKKEITISGLSPATNYYGKRSCVVNYDLFPNPKLPFTTLP